jgi:uncharacterized integral membrane protein
MTPKSQPRDQTAEGSVPRQPADRAELTGDGSAGPSELRAASAPPESPPPGMTRKGKVRRTRASAWWVGLIIAAVILVALLIFIAQNSASVAVRYLGVDGHVPLAIALMLSAIAGVLLVAIPGTARMIQLRRALKKNAGDPGSTQR